MDITSGEISQCENSFSKSMSETNDAKLKEGNADDAEDADDADDAGAYIVNWPELSNAVLLDFKTCFQFVADQFCFACLNWDPLCHIMFLLFFWGFFSPEPLDTHNTKICLFAGPAEKENRGK